MQLVAYGAQDIYLTGNPQITFFKVVYRRHTNFSMEALEQTWSGNSTAEGSSTRCSSVITRNGDLIGRMYLELCGDENGLTGNTIDADGVGTDTNASTYESTFGSSWIEHIDLEIGGQLIDRHSGDWLETYSQLTQKNSTASMGHAGEHDNNFKFGTLFQRMSGQGGTSFADGCKIKDTIYIPLQFWFCRNPGLFLPLIALQYHEVKVILNYNNLAISDISTNKLWCDYIYLDTDERRRFAQVSHEYLIEQIQEQTITPSDQGGESSPELRFNHPVKELVFFLDKQSAQSVAEIVRGDREESRLGLKLNGHERFEPRPWRYFSETQILQYHTGNPVARKWTIPEVDNPVTNYRSNRPEFLGLTYPYIGVYSFALKPEEHQPSGTCNFSRIDSATLKCKDLLTKSLIKVYAVNYNVLRIMSGMGGLAYSN